MNLVTKYNPDVFLDENIFAFHVTCVLHDCRQSGRMEHLGIENKKKSWLSLNEEIKLAEIIGGIVREKGFVVWAFNVCGDHVHMILVCGMEELSKIVQCLKAMSARAFNVWKGTTLSKGACSLVSTCRGETQNHLWAQKFNHNPITTEEQLFKTFQYILLNRHKHNLPECAKLNHIIYGDDDPLDSRAYFKI